MQVLNKFGLHYNNDIVLTDKKLILNNINDNAAFSFSFLILLIGSTIICTLGLLLNSTPVVIGGMIISPLMWPLIKTAVGISNEDPVYIRQAIVLFILAILITLISSALITYISPIKSLTTQILARTTPTLLDLIIALVAGTVAALAVTQPKISESLAGVAIATSLMPPLCVSGIGLALFNYSTFTGGFFLFFVNAVAIIFVAILVFSFIGIKRRTKSQLQKKGVYVLIGILFILAIPLYFYLKSYAFKAKAYQDTQTILQQDFKKISSAITVANINTNLSNINGEKVIIEAQILLPQNISIDYNQQQQIINDLQNSLNKKVDLTLNIQQTISILSEQDLQDAKIKKTIQQIFLNTLSTINPEVTIDTLVMTKVKDSWTVNATLHANPSVIFTQANRQMMEKILTNTIKKTVAVNLTITPLIQLQSNETVANDKITQDVQKTIATFINPSSISNVSILPPNLQTATQSATILVELTEPYGYILPDIKFVNLKALLEKKYNEIFTIHVNIVNEDSTTY
ncbi:hypothetical protein BH10PAT1_BH10PAT1_7130 [soil metagenome]